MITLVRRTTPCKSSELIYNILTLDLHGDLEALASFNRNKGVVKLNWAGKHPTKTTYTGHRLHWKSLSTEILGTNNTQNDRIEEHVQSKNYIIKQSSLENYSHSIESQLNIYTDGSLTTEHIGAGYTIQLQKEEIMAKCIRLPLYSTVFQAKIIANKSPHHKYIKILLTLKQQ